MIPCLFALTAFAGIAEAVSLFGKINAGSAKKAFFAALPLALALFSLLIFIFLGAFPTPSIEANAIDAASVAFCFFLGWRLAPLKRALPRADKKSLRLLAKKYSIPKRPFSHNFYGYRLEDSVSGGKEDPNFAFASSYPYWKLAAAGKIVGEPGAGLASAPFDAALSRAGAKGERLLAKFFALACPSVRIYASLFGLRDGKKAQSDIDLVLAGVDGGGTVRLWMIDVKNYRGGEGVVYDEASPGVLVRIDERKRAFLEGFSSSPILKMSGNMGRQKREWGGKMAQCSFKIADEWEVCVASAAKGSQPKVAKGVKWPGKIRAADPYQIAKEVNAAGLSPRIPAELHSLLSSMLKP